GLEAIVVGSGIGGLAAAALLAKVGKRVLVLEQHGKLGGCCHTFSEKGFEFDTGIHYVGEMQEGSIARFMLDRRPEGQLEWAPLPAVYDIVVLGEPGRGRTYRICSGNKEYFQGLKEQFPGEGAAIDEFERLVKVEEASASPRGDFLGSDPSLRGMMPSKASFSMHSILVNHFLQGAWYPKGGPAEIAFHTIPVIRKAGGNVLGRALVEKILLDSQGKACGVSVKKGQEVVNIFAPLIISDAGIFNTYERLLPAEARALPEIQSQLRMVTHGQGTLTVFVGLNGSWEELGLEPANYFIYPGNDLEEITNRYLASSREEAAQHIPLLFVTCPSAKDPTWETRHPGKSTLAIMTFARYEWFEEWKDKQVTKRGDDYEELKKTFVDTAMQAVFKLYPRIKDRIEYISGGTPLTNQHYIASPRGQIYGIEHSPANLQAEALATMRAQTAIPNLYLTGQDLCLGGFIGALQGAFICASAVLKRNLYADVVWLKKRAQATSAKKQC
ncbi:all-trans-retinol 13,14-reductase, partial [Egretta garzetta]|uniref:all-trans-retinol 13,14-reductase n=1 Tax=Egretta garzetta TaxID=188379 RepID=UPI00163C9EFF